MEASCPGLVLHFLLYAGDLSRQVFFAVAAEVDLDHPEEFLAQAAERAPDVLADLVHLDPHAQIGALILLKPRRVIEVLFGSCPVGYLGLLSRFGSGPIYGKETYKLAFGLFAEHRHRHRAKVLGQIEGQLRAEHVAVVAGLDDVLVHPRLLERARPDEVAALNTFARIIPDLCGATPQEVKASLDVLPAGVRGVRIGEWAQGWLGRQVRPPFEPPIPETDPDLKLRLGADLISLGRRFRNCASQRQSFSFVGERLIYECTRPGEAAVLELLRLTSGTKTYWVCEDLLASRNRRVTPALAAAVREKLDEYGILYQSLVPLPAGEQALHNLLDHHVRPAWDENFVADQEVGDAALERLLDDLEEAA